MADIIEPKPWAFIPPVVKNLMIINVLIFLACLALKRQFNIDLVDLFGMHYVGSSKFAFYQVFTAAFLHDTTNFWHVASNMLGLYFIGTTLEKAVGSRSFLVFYLIAAIAANAVQASATYLQLHTVMDAIQNFADNPTRDGFQRLYTTPGIDGQQFVHLYEYLQDIAAQLQKGMPKYELVTVSREVSTYATQTMNDNVVIGASGAVEAVFGAFVLLWPNALLYLYLLIPVKAKYLLGLIFAYEVFTGYISKSTDNIAHGAHIGGILFGLLYALLVFRKTTRFNVY